MRREGQVADFLRIDSMTNSRVRVTVNIEIEPIKTGFQDSHRGDNIIEYYQVIVSRVYCKRAELEEDDAIGSIVWLWHPPGDTKNNKELYGMK